MALPTISAGDLMGKGVTGMPANPELSVADLQAKFDELSIDVIVPKIQALVTALENASAGADLGVTAPTGITASNKVKSVLDAISVILLEIKNKSDGNYDYLVTLLAGITVVSDVVDGLSTTIPTAKAITDFIETIGGGDMLKATYDTNNNGKVDDCDTNGGWKTYKDLASISEALDLNSSTILQIATAMQDNSVFKTIVTNENAIANSDIPTNQSGYLEITKTLLTGTTRRIVVDYKDYGGGIYQRMSSASDGTILSQWFELITRDKSTWIDIKSEITKLPNGASITIDYALYNPATKEVRISIAGDSTFIADGNAVLELPTMYRPTAQIIIGNSQSAKRGTVLTTNDYVNGSTIVTTTGRIAPYFELGVALYYLRANFSYIVR